MNNYTEEFITRLLAWSKLRSTSYRAIIESVTEGSSVVAVAGTLGVSRTAVQNTINDIIAAYGFPRDIRTWKAVGSALTANMETVDRAFDSISAIEGSLQAQLTSFHF